MCCRPKFTRFSCFLFRDVPLLPKLFKIYTILLNCKIVTRLEVKRAMQVGTSVMSTTDPNAFIWIGWVFTKRSRLLVDLYWCSPEMSKRSQLVFWVSRVTLTWREWIAVAFHNWPLLRVGWYVKLPIPADCSETTAEGYAGLVEPLPQGSIK